MVKLKTILDVRRAKADGTYSILFRITNHKQVKYIPFGLSVHENHWDSKTLSINKCHPNAGPLNSAISKKFYEIQKAIINLEDNECYTFENLKAKLSPNIKEPQKSVSFNKFAGQIIADLIKVKRTGNALIYSTAVNRLTTYCNYRQIQFEEITFTLLDDFKNSLASEGLKKNSIGNYFRSLRAIYNKAIKAKIVDRALYPFKDITIKTEKTAKRGISASELADIFNHPKSKSSQEWHSANYFFLSFALRGISFTDMAYLTSANIIKDYLTYRRRKTKKLYTIKVHPVAKQILAHYNNSDNGYLLPVFPKGIVEDSEAATKRTRQWIKTTNKYLNRIASEANLELNITTYVIRHTWATLAKRMGFTYEMIAEGLGHEYGNKITNIYLDTFDQALIDEMNDRIIISIIPCPKMVWNAYKFILRPSNDLKNYKRHKTEISTYMHNMGN